MPDGTLRFGYDGDGGLGDRLVAAVLRGDKAWQLREAEPVVVQHFELLPD